VVVIEQLLNTRRRKEQLLEGIQPDDKLEYYEKPEELLETLLLCYDSMVGKKFPFIYLLRIIMCLKVKISMFLFM
jgi:phosphoenolpyruvate carboxylase